MHTCIHTGIGEWMEGGTQEERGPSLIVQIWTSSEQHPDDCKGGAVINIGSASDSFVLWKTHDAARHFVMCQRYTYFHLLCGDFWMLGWWCCSERRTGKLKPLGLVCVR